MNAVLPAYPHTSYHFQCQCSGVSMPVLCSVPVSLRCSTPFELHHSSPQSAPILQNVASFQTTHSAQPLSHSAQHPLALRPAPPSCVGGVLGVAFPEHRDQEEEEHEEQEEEQRRRGARGGGIPQCVRCGRCVRVQGKISVLLCCT